MNTTSNPPGHVPYGAPALFYAWELTSTGRVRWQWNDEGLAVRYCVMNSLTLMKTDETNQPTRDYFAITPAPTLEQCREIAGLISGGDIDRLMERDGACVAWVCGEYGRLQSENGALREALTPFAKVADEYDKNCLDECRPDWGDGREKDEETELLQGRGGKRLLVLRDFIAARSTLNHHQPNASGKP